MFKTLGIPLNVEGALFYGMHIEEVIGQIKDNIYLDDISCILVGVQKYFSVIVDYVVSQYRQDFLILYSLVITQSATR